jgi:hypothetical protein
MDMTCHIPQSTCLSLLKAEDQEYIEKQTIHKREASSDFEYCNIQCKKTRVIFDSIHPCIIEEYDKDLQNDLRQGLSIRFV